MKYADSRPGLKTTEFWLALTVVAMGACAQVFSTSPWAQVGGIIGAALAMGGYGLSRARAKTGS